MITPIRTILRPSKPGSISGLVTIPDMVGRVNAAHGQLLASKDNPADIDADMDGLPDQIEVLIDARADVREYDVMESNSDAETDEQAKVLMDSLAVPDLNFVRYTELSNENRGPAESPIPVYPSAQVEHAEYAGQWDADLDGIPDPFDPTPGNGMWDKVGEERPWTGKLDHTDPRISPPVNLDIDSIPILEPAPQRSRRLSPPIPRIPSSLSALPISPPSSSGRGRWGR